MKETDRGRRGVIIGHGRFLGTDTERALLHQADLVVAADGGALLAWEAGRRADVAVGDWDSLGTNPASPLNEVPEYLRGCKIISAPCEKDETDLELALQEAVRQGCSEVVFLGALGGRLDQSLANVQLLLAAVDRGVRAQIVDGGRRVWLMNSAVSGLPDEVNLAELEFSGRPGEYVSLLPVTGVAGGVWTEGLRYPLVGEDLYLGKTRGISNELVREMARVKVGQGALLVVIPGSESDEPPHGERSGVR